MQWLNYHHLLYFWAAARHGSIARAAAELRLAQPTISGQIRTLEQHLGEKLFERAGRGLRLTEVGRVVFRYAEEIFGLGNELLDTLRGQPTGRPARLAVGVADVVPKLVAYRLLAPALRGPERVQVEIHEDKPERLLAELALHELDLVLSDSPMAAGVSVRAYNHPLGDSPVSMFAPPALARRYKRNFPRSLDGAPMILPTANTRLRRNLDHWLSGAQIRPQVIAEIEDSALMQLFGQREGLFPGPTAIAADIARQYDVAVVGEIPDLRESYFAISVERRITNPAVKIITEAARSILT